MKVGVLFPSRFEDPGEFLADARAMEAAGVDSVWMEEASDGLDALLALAAIAAVTSELRLGLLDAKPLEPNRLATIQHLSRNRLIASSQRWQQVDAPTDRETWAKTLEDADGSADGVLVPLDPRLLDILRHPHDAIDRSDLILAQG
jgi:alkanesulfonate monooxygenase SsuD/methylene tetrahydromethanopterin reductase-like flavin-dependent oxidoreductase (luciferase family)